MRTISPDTPANELNALHVIAANQMLAYRANVQFAAQPSETLAGWAISDAKALITALQTQPEIEPNRLEKILLSMEQLINTARNVYKDYENGVQTSAIDHLDFAIQYAERALKEGVVNA